MEDLLLREYNQPEWLWKFVQCEKGNWHIVWIPGGNKMINLPFNCMGTCLERTETNEQTAEEFRKMHEEEVKARYAPSIGETETPQQQQTEGLI